jgi:hypothetical protein
MDLWPLSFFTIILGFLSVLSYFPVCSSYSLFDEPMSLDSFSLSAIGFRDLL